MGRLEKIVVVTVLFLVAVILGVSLNSSSSNAGSSDENTGKGPLSNQEGGRNGPRARRNTELAAQAQDAAGQAPGQAGNAAAGTPQAGTPSTAPTNPNGLLNAAVTPTNAAGHQPASQPAANATPPGNAPLAAGQTPPTNASKPAAPAGFLVSREGLEATATDDWMLYTWKTGDSFKDLAQRFYGSQLHVARLRAANEGRDETKLVAGDKILVAVKSASALDGAAQVPQVKDATKDGADKKSAWAGGLYEVKSGDVLGTISQQVYGTSKKWKKIYDANRDLIGDNPNKLVLGTKLRIPE